MNTPTPEQLQDAAIWLSEQDYQNNYNEKDYQVCFNADMPTILTAYANHVLTNHEGFKSNAELKRKLAALQERLKAEQDYSMMMKEQFESVHTQLTDARKEIEGLKDALQMASNRYIVLSDQYVIPKSVIDTIIESLP